MKSLLGETPWQLFAVAPDCAQRLQDLIAEIIGNIGEPDTGELMMQTLDEQTFLVQA